MKPARLACLAAILALIPAARGRASTIDSTTGALEFASNALFTSGFESVASLQGNGKLVTWGSSSVLSGAPIVDQPVLSSVALEGAHSLLLNQSLGAAIALVDATLFQELAQKRISISFWGQSFGAQPVLEVIYTNPPNLGPGVLARVVAIRTGRETSDGWAEYSTGPIDGSVWGMNIGAVLMSAYYATSAGNSMLIGPEMAPDEDPPTLADPSAFAVADALEIAPEDGAITAATSCTAATEDAVCGSQAHCWLAHCVDSSVVWGPVPQAADHRSDVVARSTFVAENLLADRKATASALTLFASTSQIASATSPRLFYGALNQLVSTLRDGHTTFGTPPSTNSIFYPFPSSESGPPDACFGWTEDDVDPGDNLVFSVFLANDQGTLEQTLKAGDILTAIDGEDPMTWVESMSMFAKTLPNDPTSDPGTLARYLSDLIGHHAQTMNLSRCASGQCTALPVIDVGDQVKSAVLRLGYFPSSDAYCSPRFLPAVSSPPSDKSSAEPVVVETSGSITSVQFDGFDPSSNSTWESSMEGAFSAGGAVLVDARLGFGGEFELGGWLFHYLRGTDQPYGMFAMPRGAYDNPDPSWLFAPSWDSCVGESTAMPGPCDWAGYNSIYTDVASPAGEAAQIAWLNTSDLSMNDIEPRSLQGRANFRVFSPHPTTGAYGEISRLPPVELGWMNGSLAVMDMRFGDTPTDARAAPWESGKGVVPQQVVTQKLSDLLAGQDTLLNAARAWLAP